MDGPCPLSPKMSIFLGDLASWRELEISRDGQILKHDFSSRQDAKTPRVQGNQSLWPSTSMAGLLGSPDCPLTAIDCGKADVQRLPFTPGV
jgi:hypothetical protein